MEQGDYLGDRSNDETSEEEVEETASDVGSEGSSDEGSGRVNALYDALEAAGKGMTGQFQDLCKEDLLAEEAFLVEAWTRAVQGSARETKGQNESKKRKLK